jgi:hypothetical protein
LIVYIATENLGAADRYDGGGRHDVINLELTRAVWVRPGFPESLRVPAHMAAV